MWTNRWQNAPLRVGKCSPSPCPEYIMFLNLKKKKKFVCLHRLCICVFWNFWALKQQELEKLLYRLGSFSTPLATYRYVFLSEMSRFSWEGNLEKSKNTSYSRLLPSLCRAGALKLLKGYIKILRLVNQNKGLIHNLSFKCFKLLGKRKLSQPFLTWPGLRALSLSSSAFSHFGSLAANGRVRTEMEPHSPGTDQNIMNSLRMWLQFVSANTSRKPHEPPWCKFPSFYFFFFCFLNGHLRCQTCITGEL